MVGRKYEVIKVVEMRLSFVLKVILLLNGSIDTFLSADIYVETLKVTS